MCGQGIEELVCYVDCRQVLGDLGETSMPFNLLRTTFYISSEDNLYRMLPSRLEF